METLTFYLENAYLSTSEYIDAAEVLAMASPFSLIIANIKMGYFENLALGSTQLNPSLWLSYIDGAFIHWSHQIDMKVLQHHLNSINPLILFTIETEKRQVFNIPGCNISSHAIWF